MPKEEKDQADWHSRLKDLVFAKERLERELSKRSAAYRAATKKITLTELLASLPKGTVLVDYLEFGRLLPSNEADNKQNWDRQLVAFVVRHAEREDDRVRMVPLGSVVPLRTAINTWRKSFDSTPDGAAAGKAIRTAVWQPIVEHLAGADTILVSTDGALNRLPLGALPGKQPDTYLIEDHRLAVIPVPQLIPALVNLSGYRTVANQLLLLGDIDYDVAPSDAAEPTKEEHPPLPGMAVRSATDGRLFDPLDNTAGEIAAIKDLYRELYKVKSDDDLLSLTKAKADEARFRALAPQYRHLHLATHGFFAGEQYSSSLGSRSGVDRDRAMLANLDFELVGYNPGLLSGLALTGANLEPSASSPDGIITAQEIGAMDLSGVDTVVLSACDTGLGETAGGEGLLGVQRAFQVAGARTTVASFWKVNDLVTRSLMERFYRNLWKKKSGSRLDALRDAQLYVLNHPEEIRGVDLVADPNQPRRRTSPKYWAAFTLSGDWR